MEDFQSLIEDMISNNESIEIENRQNIEIGQYTSVDAFVSISHTFHIIDGQPFIIIWFTDAFGTNDNEEISYGFDFMMDSFSAIESCLYHKEDRFIVSNFGEELKRSNKYKNKSPEEIRFWLTHDEATPFIMSLTRKIDDIDMWLKTYGFGGKGVCLLFDFTDIDNFRCQSDFLIHGPFSIVYGNQIGFLKEKNILRGMVWKEYLKFLKDVRLLDEFDAILERKLAAMDQVCSLLSSFIKGEKWYNESEVRMTALRHFYPFNCLPKTVCHVNGKNHIDVAVPLSCLKRIIIGPCVDDEDIIRIRENAKMIGLSNENITISEVPLK